MPFSRKSFSSSERFFRLYRGKGATCLAPDGAASDFPLLGRPDTSAPWTRDTCASRERWSRLKGMSTASSPLVAVGPSTSWHFRRNAVGWTHKGSIGDAGASIGRTSSSLSVPGSKAFFGANDGLSDRCRVGHPFRLYGGGGCSPARRRSFSPHASAVKRGLQETYDGVGRTVLMTGANSGIGLEASKQLVACGCTVVMACRSADKANRAVAEVTPHANDGGRAVPAVFDLASLASVRDFAHAYLETGAPLDVLVCNAVRAGYLAHMSRLSRSATHLPHASHTHTLSHTHTHTYTRARDSLSFFSLHHFRGLLLTAERRGATAYNALSTVSRKPLG